MNNQLLPKQYLAYLLCLLVNIIFCFHYYAAKIVITAGVHPLALSGVRGIIGGLFLLAFHRNFFKHLNKRLLVELVLVAAFGFYLNQMVFLFGVKRTSPLNVSLIINTIPIVITLFSVICGLEKMGKKKGLGLFIGFASVVLLSGLSNNFQFGEGNIGDLLIFLNVIFYGISVIISKRVLHRDIPSYILPIAVLLIGGLMHTFSGLPHLPQLVNYCLAGHTQLLLILFEAIVSTGLVYLMIFTALKVLSPSSSSIFAYLQPIVILLIDYFALSKTPSSYIFPIIFAIVLSGYMVLSSRE